MTTHKKRLAHTHRMHRLLLTTPRLSLLIAGVFSFAFSVGAYAFATFDAADFHAAAPAALSAELDPAAYVTTSDYLRALSAALDTRDLTQPFVYEKEFDGRTVYVRFDAAEYDANHTAPEIAAKIADIAAATIHPELP